MASQSDDEKRQREVIDELRSLGIRYQDERAEPPKDDAESIAQEKRALEVRLGPVLNRKVGETPDPPTLTIIDGGKDPQDER